MADYITAIRTADGDKKIDYESLANLLKINGADAKGNLIDLLYPIGSVYMTSTNTNPTDILGGTWNLTGKAFESAVISDDSLFTADSTNVSAHTMVCVRSGNSLRVRLHVTTAVAVDDTEVSLGTFNLESMGVSLLHYSLSQYPGASDGGNCIPIFKLDYSTGALSVADIIGQTSGSIESEKVLVLDFTVPVSHEAMDADFCNKFYWERTA